MQTGAALQQQGPPHAPPDAAARASNAHAAAEAAADTLAAQEAAAKTQERQQQANRLATAFRYVQTNAARLVSNRGTVMYQQLCKASASGSWQTRH